MTPQDRCEHHHGVGGLGLLLAFAGGALLGGLAGLLLAPRAGAVTRRRLADAVDQTGDMAARVPQAINAASLAAQDAFSAALKGTA
jgi:gas vesicle protein